jgi:hypothetical protein
MQSTAQDVTSAHHHPCIQLLWAGTAIKLSNQGPRWDTKHTHLVKAADVAARAAAAAAVAVLRAPALQETAHVEIQVNHSAHVV